MPYPELNLVEINFQSVTGTIKIDGENITVSQPTVFLNTEGEIIVEGICLEYEYRDISKFDMEFEDVNGWMVSITNCTKTNFSSPSGKLRAKCIKLNANRGQINIGDEVTMFKLLTGISFAADQFEEVCGVKERKVINFNPNDLKDIILVKSQFPKRPEINGYFAVKGSIDNIEMTFKQTFDNIEFLLNFAASNFIALPITYIRSSTAEKLEIRPGINETGRGSSILYLQYPGTLSNFINSTYEQYKNLCNVLDLQKLFHYYIMMKNTGFLENAYLLGSVFMEGLKYSYAKNKYKIDTNGFFLKPNTNKTFTFIELIKEIYQTYGIKKGDTEFIKYRNEVIHRGDISLPFPDLLDKVIQLEITIEHLILNILNYNGLYWDRTRGSWIDYKLVEK